MAKPSRSWPLGVKVFVTVNGVIIIATAVGLSLDVGRHYRSYHALLHERMVQDARIWQLAWRRATADEGASLGVGQRVFQHFVENYQQLTSESQPRETFLLVAAPSPPGRDVPQVLATVPADLAPTVRAAMLGAWRQPHTMTRLGGRPLMVVTLPIADRPAEAAAGAPTTRPADLAGQRLVAAEFIDRLQHEISQQVVSRLFLGIVTVLWILAMVNLLLRRWVTRPIEALNESVERIGRRDYSHPVSTRWGTRELDGLADNFEAARLRLAEAERIRQADMDRARRTQQALLGRLDRPLRGLTVAGHYAPADHVGGDLYDLQAEPDGRVTVMVGDATGHGVAAALMMATIKMDLNHLVAHGAGAGDLSATAAQLNGDLLAVSEAGDFATLLVLQLPPGGGVGRYLNAGHPAGRLIRRGGAIEPLDSTGPLVGALPDGRWQQRELRVGPGDRIVLTTDGLGDSMNPAGARFGVERLDALLVRHAARSPAELVEAVVAALADWTAGGEPDDDVTLLVIDCDTVD